MLPKHLEKYFWDTDFKTVDKEKHKDYIIVKLLEYGDIPALRWLFSSFSQRKIKETFTKSRGFSKRVANFWRLYFDISKNKIVCFNKSFLGKQKELWPY